MYSKKANNGSCYTFTADAQGRYTGQSTGLIKSVQGKTVAPDYRHVVLINNETRKAVLVDKF